MDSIVATQMIGGNPTKKRSDIEGASDGKE